MVTEHDQNNEIRINAALNAYYNYWFESSLQKDKALLYISLGALAFFGNFFMAGNLPICFRILCSIVLVLFTISSLGVIYILSLNCDFILEKIEDHKSIDSIMKLLKNLDIWVAGLFSLGVIFALILILSKGFSS